MSALRLRALERLTNSATALREQTARLCTALGTLKAKNRLHPCSAFSAAEYGFPEENLAQFLRKQKYLHGKK